MRICSKRSSYVIALLLCILSGSFSTAIGVPTPQDTTGQPAAQPVVTFVGPVSNSIIGITIQGGKVNLPPSGSGDTYYERCEGDGLNDDALSNKFSYLIQSSNDAPYNSPINPVEVYRKTKPIDVAIKMNSSLKCVAREHTVYLKLPSPLTIDKTYTINFSFGGLPAQTYRYNKFLRSEAVHVSHIGFKPNDNKFAFFSLWMGDNGDAYSNRSTANFYIIDKNGNQVYPVMGAGTGVLKPASESEGDEFKVNNIKYQRNYSGVNVWKFDFSDFTTPGLYRVYVEGVGTSYYFTIDDYVWQEAFYTSVRGLYHQRSGIALGEPYTDFTRQIMFSPPSPVVYVSSQNLMNTANGIGGLDPSVSLLNGRDPTNTLSDASGGYCDAGDWDRRIQHLNIAMLLFDLYDSNPTYFNNLNLNIPQDYPGLPDLINEALWGVDFFKKLQINVPNDPSQHGAVRGGIESGGHPIRGQGSWNESQFVMAYAPDVWSSYLYAAAAARASYILSKYFPSSGGSSGYQSQYYLNSALIAMRWAENKIPASALKDGSSYQNSYVTAGFRDVREARNLAAIELYRATNDNSPEQQSTHWHDIFLKTTFFDTAPDFLDAGSHNQGEAAWVCANITKPLTNNTYNVSENCKQSFIQEANLRISYQQQTGFGWAKNAWLPGYAGAFTVPDVIHIVRAHRLYHNNSDYMKSIILATQSGLGANPLNISYTTGVGYKYPRHAMHVDSRIMGKSPPRGLTVLGPIDLNVVTNPNYFDGFVYPARNTWPVLENYWDNFWDPLVNEYLVSATIAPTAYVWGYLASRGQSSPLPKRTKIELSTD